MEFSTQFAPSLGDTASDVSMWRALTTTYFRSVEDVKGLTIDQIVMYKENDIIAHEYLVFRVRSMYLFHESFLHLPGILHSLRFHC